MTGARSLCLAGYDPSTCQHPEVVFTARCVSVLLGGCHEIFRWCEDYVERMLRMCSFLHRDGVEVACVYNQKESQQGSKRRSRLSNDHNCDAQSQDARSTAPKAGRRDTRTRNRTKKWEKVMCDSFYRANEHPNCDSDVNPQSSLASICDHAE